MNIYRIQFFVNGKWQNHLYHFPKTKEGKVFSGMTETNEKFKYQDQIVDLPDHLNHQELYDFLSNYFTNIERKEKLKLI